MRPSDVASTIVTGAFGALTGSLLGGVVGSALGLVGGVAFGAVAGRANVRPGVAMTVFVGAMSGILIGSSIVETICLPETCVALEATAGVVSGIAAFIGVGLVAALVTRSFDEYREATAEGREPPTPGCEAEPPEPSEDQST